jgi:uncharacterized membrane protein (DUF373 family)
MKALGLFLILVGLGITYYIVSSERIKKTFDRLDF